MKILEDKRFNSLRDYLTYISSHEGIRYFHLQQIEALLERETFEREELSIVTGLVETLQENLKIATGHHHRDASEGYAND